MDGNNHKTVWKYDQYGHVTNKLDNLETNLFFYGYDADNRLTNRISAAKGTTIYRYDAAGNLTNVVYPVSSAITMKYDALNRLMTNIVDGVFTNIYSYDAAGQLLSEGGIWSHDTVTYSYKNRLRTGLTVPNPNASPWNENYDYDSARRLRSLTSPAGTFSFQFLDSKPSTLIAQLSLPNGAAWKSCLRLERQSRSTRTRSGVHHTTTRFSSCRRWRI